MIPNGTGTTACATSGLVQAGAGPTNCSREHAGDLGSGERPGVQWLAGLSGRQPNDPSRVAAIIEAVTSPEPPLRLVIGTEAVQAIREKLTSQRRDLDAWEHLSASTTVTV